MFKKLKLITLFLALAFASSCTIKNSDSESPVIYFSNASESPISNIRAVWAGDNILTLDGLAPGDSRSQAFYLDDTDDFFGLVKISWNNARGHGVSRELFFKPNNLPSINDDTTYNYVQIYLEQNDLEFMTSDAADLGNKTRRRDRMLKSYKESYGNNSPVHVPSSLMRVEPITRDTSMEGWVTRSY